MSLKTVELVMGRPYPEGWHPAGHEQWETCPSCGNLAHEEWMRDDGVRLVAAGWSLAHRGQRVWKTYEKSGSRIDYLSDLEMTAFEAMEEINTQLPLVAGPRRNARPVTP